MFKTADGIPIDAGHITKRIADYIGQDPDGQYEITVGTDSQNHGQTKMVEVIAVHRHGKGGIYFYNIEYVKRIQNLRQKINEETSRSLHVADGLLDGLECELMMLGISIGDLNLSFQIHCDIGRYGKTNMLIKEITKWVTSYGYLCCIKPYSYAASGIANKYSK